MLIKLILAGIFLPLFALNGWFQKRLNDALAERHPQVLQMIDSMTPGQKRSARAHKRHMHYRTLQDPEIERHIRNLDRVQILLSSAVLGIFALFGIFLLVTAWRH